MKCAVRGCRRKHAGPPQAIEWYSAPADAGPDPELPICSVHRFVYNVLGDDFEQRIGLGPMVFQARFLAIAGPIADRPEYTLAECNHVIAPPLGESPERTACYHGVCRYCALVAIGEARRQLDGL